MMWPALAKANGIDPKSVTWVNIDANAKLAALKAQSIDVTTSFYNLHHVFKRELGDDMGFLAWRDAGLNPVRQLGDRQRRFLRSQGDCRQFRQGHAAGICRLRGDPKPCVQALIDANGALKFDNELENWELVEVLMSDKYSREVALGSTMTRAWPTTTRW